MQEILFVVIGLLSVIVVLRLLAGPKATSAMLKGQDGERRVAGIVKSLGYPALHDIYLPSTNGTTQIDHVVRVGNGIFVIETKNLSGAIYGTASDRNWRQVFRRGSSRSFLNPIKQNAIHYKSVRQLVGPEADIRPLVVMAGSATFPQGIPDGVIPITDLKQHLRLAFVDAGRYGTVEKPWETIVTVAAGTNRRVAKAEHAKTLKRMSQRLESPSSKGRIEPSFERDA